VLDYLVLRHHMKPDTETLTARIDDAVRADSQLTVGKPDVAPPVIPGWEPFGRRLQHVSQCGRPEMGRQVGVLAVDDQLESGRHRTSIVSAAARAPMDAMSKGRRSAAGKSVARQARRSLLGL